MLPFGVTIPATVPQGSEIPEGLMNNPVQFRFIYLFMFHLVTLPASQPAGRQLGQYKVLKFVDW
jgi:hypothetical protein